MKNIKFLFLAAIMLVAKGVYAQNIEDDSEIMVVEEEIEDNGERHPIHINPFWDNWFVGVGIGSSTFYGNHCKGTNIGERTAPVFNLHAGKWFTPNVGLRMNFYWYQPKSFDTNPNNPLVVKDLGNGLYKTKWTMTSLTAEAMVNMSNLICGYKRDRLYNFIGYIGGGWIRNCTRKHPNDVVLSTGILNRFNINESWGLNLELRASIFPEKMSYAEYGGKWDQDMLTSLMVGASYRFKYSGWNTCNVSTSEINALNAKINDMRAKNAELKDALAEKPKVQTVEVVKVNTYVPDMCVFFKINKSDIREEEKVNIAMYAENIKKAKDKKFSVTGYADKYTGNDKINTPLSKNRAQKVYDMLVNEFGVDKNQLVIDHKGGVDNMFYDIPKLSRVTVIRMIE